MKKITILLGLLIIASSAMGFDGQRKGFVFGGGLGFSPASQFKVQSGEFSGSETTKAGIGLNLIIGYAWDEFNMILYEGNVTAYDVGGYSSDNVVAQGFDGLSWYHYYGPSGKTFYSVVGMGTYNFQDSNDNSFDMGFGMLLGGGYEFARHWQVGGYLGFGKTSYRNIDYSHVHFSVLIGGVAF